VENKSRLKIMDYLVVDVKNLKIMDFLLENKYLNKCLNILVDYLIKNLKKVVYLPTA
jgi:hypothetical protein